jgi:type II secretory pathway pseudopilin PulG
MRAPRPFSVSVRRVARARHGDEGGETLIELLATVILLGTAVVAVISGLYTAVRSSDQHKRRTRTAAEVTNVVEVLSRTDYIPCTSGVPNYSSVLPSLPSGYTLLPLVVEPLASASAADPSWSATCPTEGDQGAQRITVVVSQGTGEREVREELVYVKRSRECPPPPPGTPANQEPYIEC